MKILKDTSNILQNKQRIFFLDMIAFEIKRKK